LLYEKAYCDTLLDIKNVLVVTATWRALVLLRIPMKIQDVYLVE
jgi:hypothetical protein